MVMAQIRRPWTWEEVEKLLNMAQKYPTAQIASEIGRPIPSRLIPFRVFAGPVQREALLNQKILGTISRNMRHTVR
jgi:hypothetical protein